MSSSEPDRLVPPVTPHEHCQGNLMATVTLVQYGDYQCPGSGLAHRIVPLIQQLLGAELHFVFRHFPQPEIHPEAYHAAEAAEAAASQGKFWEMHNHLFRHQSRLADSYLVEYAIALCLDVNQFLAEMASDCHTPRIQADIKSGIQSGVITTPTFFINGLKYNDAQSLEGLLEAVVRISQNER